MKPIIFSIAALAALPGCGYIESGVWEDDANNWIRAFNEIKPAAIEVVRSRYMKTPHWSHEFEYFFHVKASTAAREKIITTPGLKRYAQPADLTSPVDSFFEEKPSWFIPRDFKHYDIWIRQSEPRSSFRVFEDRETGELYISDNQI